MYFLNNIEHICMFLLVIHVSFMKCLLKSLTHLHYWVVFYYSLVYKSLLHIMERSVLFDLCAVNIFSQSVVCLSFP